MNRCEEMLHKFTRRISKILSLSIVDRDSNNFMWDTSYRICQNMNCVPRIILQAEIIWNKNLYFVLLARLPSNAVTQSLAHSS